jgi:hypothetical protein
VASPRTLAIAGLAWTPPRSMLRSATPFYGPLALPLPVSRACEANRH